MNRLIKYLLIIYSILVIFIILGYTFNALYENYASTHIPETQYDSRGPLPSEKPTTETPYYFLKRLIGIFNVYIFPLFVIFMSALFLYKEKTGYFKSLIIPTSFTVLGIIASFVWLFNFAEGEEGMGIIILLPLFTITLILSVIINAIILAIVKE